MRLRYLARNVANAARRDPKRFHGSRSDFLRYLPPGGTGIELGVFRGEFSRDLLRRAQPKRLHLVDVWWTAFGELYPDWGAYTRNGSLSTREAYEEVRGVIDRYGAGVEIFVHVGDDVEYLASLADGELDWAYVDSSHQYEHTHRELAALDPKIARGGIIAGHDWYSDPGEYHHGVFRAVTEFCAERGWDVFRLDNHTQWAIRRQS
jgi:hypothetical protein